jgi:two-component system NtrC family sensor kinase
MAHASSFTVSDLETFSRDLRGLAPGAADMTVVAQRATDYLYEHLRTDDGEPECLTVALYKTQLLATLPGRLQRLARQADPTADGGTACLTQLATTGFEQPDPEPGSIVRPLTPAAFEEQPILVSLLVEMGLDVDAALDPQRALSAGVHRKDLDLFLVEDLATDDWTADADVRQQTVALGLRSMLGIGGGLPSGDLFLLFWFSHVPIDRRSADLLRSLAPAIKASLIPFSLRPFAEP